MSMNRKSFGPPLKVGGTAFLLLLTAACGGATNDRPATGAEGTVDQVTMTADEVISVSGVTDSTEFCGDREITLGIHDGFGSNGWSKSSMAAVRTEAAKCSNVKQVVEIGGGSLQKSISDVNGMVAQGIDALVIIPDFGMSQLPSLQAATRAGTKVVAWGADPGGTSGRDYVAYIDWDPRAAGVLWAEWMVKALHGKGNVVFIGGPAGNPVTGATLDGIVSVLDKNPGIKLLTGDTDWPITNWDPAQAQKTMASLIAKYPKIDGVITEDGQGSVGAIRAFVAAGRPLVPFTSLEVNDVACTYEKLKPSNPNFEVATISSRNWLGRVAARKAIAAAQDLPSGEPTELYQLPLDEDSIGRKTPVCSKDLPSDAFPDSKLTAEEIEKYGKAS